MKGDFSRDTFDKAKHFSRVLMQQGRVQLDADWNEQTAILLHYLRTLAADLIGPFAGPAGADGFKITKITSAANDFNIGPGRYYVDGILCENEGTPDKKDFTYFFQPHYPLNQNENDKLPEGTLLVYLDVWERHLTHMEVESADDRVISIREVALGGPDTATRAQVVWQVKTTNKPPSGSSLLTPPNSGWRSLVEGNKWSEWIKQWQPNNRGMLKAQAKKELKKDTEPCITSPESRYRGAENQLYRVEIHSGGLAGTATFKWSRENGSVVFPIRKLVGNKATLENIGRDERLGLKENDWVEILDEHLALRNEVGRLAQVDSIDLVEQTVTLKVEGNVLPDYQQNDPKRPLLRRWDQRASEQNEQITDGVPIREDQWLDLEDGVQVWFEKFDEVATYRPGDYWLIPARTATGDVEWPGPVGKPDALPPHGIEHHYAPLAIISVANRKVTVATGGDLRNQIKPLS